MMIIKRGITAVIFMLVVALTAPAFAQKAIPDPKIGIVDVQVIMTQALAVKSLREQMNKLTAEAQKDISAQEKALRARDKELQQQRSLLSAEVLAQRRKKFEEDAAALQLHSRQLRGTLDGGFRETLSRIQLVLVDEVRKLATARGINLVLSQSQIVVASDAFDLTGEAMEKLNKRLPTVELKLQQRPAGGKK